MRGMLLRRGDQEDHGDSLSVGTGGVNTSNIVIDHNSIMWGTDETLEFWREVSRTTFSNNIVAQGFNIVGSSGSLRGANMLIAGGSSGLSAGEIPHDISIIDNLFAFARKRNPRIADGARIEIINNYFFGVGDQDRTTQLSDDRNSVTHIDVMNKLYEAVAGEDRSNTYDTSDPFIDVQTGVNHVSGNLQLDGHGNDYGFSPGYHGAASGQAVSGRTITSDTGTSIDDAWQVRDHVLSNVGADPFDPDEVDLRILSDVRDRTTARTGGYDVQAVTDAGGWGARPSFAAPQDSDGDGMPDWFEDQVGYDRNAHDSQQDSNGDGFTNLEDYLNGFYAGYGYACTHQ